VTEIVGEHGGRGWRVKRTESGTQVKSQEYHRPLRRRAAGSA
jgi:hypothetical protein